MQALFCYGDEGKLTACLHASKFDDRNRRINANTIRINWFFEKIDNGLDFDSFVQTKGMKKRFNDFKHRIVEEIKY